LQRLRQTLSSVGYPTTTSEQSRKAPAGAVKLWLVYSAFTLIGAVFYRAFHDHFGPWSHLQSSPDSQQDFSIFYSLSWRHRVHQAIASLARNRPLAATTLGAVASIVLPSSHY